MKKNLFKLLLFIFLISNFTPVFAVELSDIELVNLHSNYVSVVEISNDKATTLFQKNADAKMYPASITKVLTTYVALINGPSLDTEIEIVYADIAGLQEANASVVGLVANETVTFETLLYGSMLPSGADASNALARVISGDINSFVQLMNQTAKEIGMTNSHFVNTSGLFDENHYSTANDINLLAELVLKNDDFKKIISSLTYTSQPTNYHPYGLVMESTLLFYSNYDQSRIGYIMGGKTGWIPESGYCLNSYSDFYNRTYIVTTCDAYEPGSQLEDHNNLYQFLFENMHTISLMSENENIGTVDLIYQDNPAIYSIINNEEITASVPIVIEREDLIYSNDFIVEAITPIKENTPIGTLTIALEDEILFENNYTFDRDIERNNLIYYMHVIIAFFQSEQFIQILSYAGILLIILIILLLVIYKLRKRKRERDHYSGYRL